MENGAVYRLRISTLGLYPFGDRQVPVRLPSNAIVTVLKLNVVGAAFEGALKGPVYGQTFVELEWEGKHVHLFSRDLEERADLVGTPRL